MSDDELDKGIKEISSYIFRYVVGGFVEFDSIVPNVLEIVSDDYDVDELQPHAERILREIVQEQLKLESQWPAVTDWDRFDAAFAQLEEAGVVCRHNFSCCPSCAASEIWDEIEVERDKGREIIGCAHYNFQDTEAAVEGQGIYLSYGSVLQGERPVVKIGHMIADAMRASGLTVRWDGTYAKRIHVALDWKRRLRDEFRSI